MDYAWWIEHIFGTSPVDGINPDVHALAESLHPTEAVHLMTRIFMNCGSDLERFNDLQVAQGLKFIAAAGESQWMYLIYDRHVPWADRKACIHSIVHVYRDCFARRCSETTSQPRQETEALDSTCFMWWDAFPSGGLSDTTDEERAVVDQELIAVMSGAIELPNNVCRRSALHGLGHWECGDPQRVHAIVDDWMARNPELPKALAEYARAARNGQVR